MQPSEIGGSRHCFRKNVYQILLSISSPTLISGTIGRYKNHSQLRSNDVKINTKGLDFLIIDEADKMVADLDDAEVLKKIRRDSVRS